ncbi:MAG: peptidase M14, partial [Burkholderiales bacterium]|nr:peptidase M14 [Burkholderiales bacterium]
MRCTLVLLVAVLGLGASASAQTTYGPEVAARFPAPSVRLDGPVFKPARQDFTSNAELAQQVEAVLREGGTGKTRIESVTPGRSQEGTPLHALRFTRGPGRPSVLLIGQQHGDEPAGAEALLILMRELAQGGDVLDKLDVVLLPRANPDGAEWLRRVAISGFDINRDHLLLRTAEARAVAALAQSHRPVVVVDAHEHTAVGRY